MASIVISVHCTESTLDNFKGEIAINDVARSKLTELRKKKLIFVFFEKRMFYFRLMQAVVVVAVAFVYDDLMCSMLGCQKPWENPPETDFA